MAQYFWTPDPADVDDVPTGWSMRSTTDIQRVQYDDSRDKYYMHVGASANRRLLVLDELSGTPAPVARDIEVFTEFLYTNSGSTQAGGNDARIALRQPIESGINGFLIGCNPRSSIAGMYSVSGQANPTSIATTSFDRAAELSTLLRQRVRAIGNTLSFKWWRAGDPEPAEWVLTTTSSAYNAPGKIGIWSFSGGLTRWYSFGIGTEGDAAPAGPVSPTPRGLKCPLVLVRGDSQQATQNPLRSRRRTRRDRRRRLFALVRLMCGIAP